MILDALADPQCMTRRRIACLGTGFIVLTMAAMFFAPEVRRELRARLQRHTVASRLQELKPRVQPVWRERFVKAGLDYPPAAITIVGLKHERELRVYAGAARLASYPFTAASGTIGPKLREGDRQVPEGLYSIDSLNPNSRYHLALRVDYPNDEDRRVAAAASRTELGGDIMIHGSNRSVGCIAVGDPAIEEIFFLAGVVGSANIELILAPSLSPSRHVTSATPGWIADRYRQLEERLREVDPDDD